MHFQLIFYSLIAIFMSTPAFGDSNEHIIGQARQLFISGDRDKALEVLSKNISENSDKKINKEKLINEGDRISRRFLKDAAQRDFELGESLRFSGKSTSESSYEKALKIEPNNVQVLDSLTLQYLSKSECSSAANTIEKIEVLWPYAERLAYLKLLVKVCRGEDLQISDTRGPKWPAEVHGFVQMIEAETLVRSGRGAEAIIIARKIKENNPKYSEPFFWIFKAAEVETGGDTEDLKKYISMCQEYDEKEKRIFGSDPRLCMKLDEAKEILKKHEALN